MAGEYFVVEGLKAAYVEQLLQSVEDRILISPHHRTYEKDFTMIQTSETIFRAHGVEAL